METKNETFSVKSLYASLKIGSLVQFPTGVVWNVWVPLKVSFFCIGSDLEESFDSQPTSKEKLVIGQSFLPLFSS